MNLANPMHVVDLQNHTSKVLLSETNYEYVANWWLLK